jgi:hypothetical protein
VNQSVVVVSIGSYSRIRGYKIDLARLKLAHFVSVEIFSRSARHIKYAVDVWIGFVYPMLLWWNYGIILARDDTISFHNIPPKVDFEQ